MFAVFSLVAGQIPSITSEVEAEPNHAWSDGFDGDFRITPDVPIQGGWRINMKFSQPISKLEVWQAKAEKKPENVEMTEFGLVNLNYNAGLPAGTRTQSTIKARSPDATDQFQRLRCRLSDRTTEVGYMKHKGAYLQLSSLCNICSIDGSIKQIRII